MTDFASRLKKQLARLNEKRVAAENKAPHLGFSWQIAMDSQQEQWNREIKRQQAEAAAAAAEGEVGQGEQ